MSIDSIHSKDFLWLFTWLVGLLVETLAVARACACGLAFFFFAPAWLVPVPALLVYLSIIILITFT